LIARLSTCLELAFQAERIDGKTQVDGDGHSVDAGPLALDGDIDGAGDGGPFQLLQEWNAR
jgi:hypothetical protein